MQITVVYNCTEGDGEREKGRVEVILILTLFTHFSQKWGTFRLSWSLEDGFHSLDYHLVEGSVPGGLLKTEEGLLYPRRPVCPSPPAVVRP